MCDQLCISKNLMSALCSSSPIVSHFVMETMIILIACFKVDEQHEPNGRSIEKENEHVFGILYTSGEISHLSLTRNFFHLKI